MRFLLCGNTKEIEKKSTLDDDLRSRDNHWSDLYRESANHHRYFLTWRQLLLGGFFALAGGTINLILNLLEDYPRTAFIPALLFVFIIVCIYFFEKRNTELYRAAINTCSQLEGSSEGFYKFIQANVRGSIHTSLIKAIYIIAGVLFLIFATILFIFNSLNYCSICN